MDAIGRAACVLAPLAFGFLSLALGQDANWDLRNYHWYNPYALLHGRFEFDVAPATFYNPLFDLPLFLAAQHVSARTCGFLLGFAQGLNFIPLYGLARILVPVWAKWARGSGGAIVAAIGICGGGALGLVGTTFQDHILSLFVLTALWWSLRKEQVSLGDAAVAGALIGAAVGFKLPMATFGVGLGAAWLAMPGSLAQRFSRVSVFGVTALGAVAVCGGYWMAYLYTTFGNPVFPYFNDVIGSNLALSASYRDVRFVPTSLSAALLFPFRSSFDPHLVGEVDFQDHRIGLLAAIAIATAAIRIVRRRALTTPALRIALIAVAGAYLAWLGIFAIYRYIVAIEMVAPVVTAALVATWPVAARIRVAIGAVCALLIVGTTQPGSWGRVEWGDRFVTATPPPVATDTMVLMVGFEPAAWVIPSFPPQVPFVRLQGYSHSPDDGDVGLAHIARTRVNEHGGEFWLLYSSYEIELARAVLTKYGLAADFSACQPIQGNLDDSLRLCPVQRRFEHP